MGREDLQGIAAQAEHAAVEVGVVALVVQLDQPAQELLAVDLLPDGERLGHGRIGLGRADAIDAGDRGDDDHVAAFEQRARGRMAHAVDLLVDGAFLLDIGVGPRHIGLGLVVVVVGDEILHRILGKEALHLAIELPGRQRVACWAHQDRGPKALRPLDDMGHGEGLARAGDAQQDLVALLALEPGDELDDGLGLVARGLELGASRSAERGRRGGDAAGEVSIRRAAMDAKIRRAAGAAVPAGYDYSSYPQLYTERSDLAVADIHETLGGRSGGSDRRNEAA